ncbi:MAG: hypothetical protein RRY65_07830 [Pseudoflavonifractor sp.]
MPKLRVPPEQRMDRLLTGYVRRWLDINGRGYKELSRLIGIGESTYFKRMKSPGGFSLKEFRAMVAVTKMRDRDVCEMLGVAYNGVTPEALGAVGLEEIRQ